MERRATLLLLKENYKMSQQNFITLDLECDSNIKDCRKYFEAPYRDPENQPWVCTFATSAGTRISFAIRLPEEVFAREFKDKNGITHRVRSYHNYDNTFENGINDCGWLMRKGNYEDFFRKIADVINNEKIDKIYYKGFGTADNFDYEVLKYWMNRYGIECRLDKLVNVYAKIPYFEMDKTAEQQKRGKWVDNNTYMNMGVKHNIEDAVLLAKTLKDRYCLALAEKE